MDEILLTNVSSLVPSKSDTNAIKNGDDDDDDDDNDDDEEVNNNKELFIAHVVSNNRFALDLLCPYFVLVPYQSNTHHTYHLPCGLTDQLPFIYHSSSFIISFVIVKMDRNNWARKTKSSKPPPDLERLRKEQDEKMNIKMAAATPSEKKRSAPDDDDDDDRKPAAAAASSKGGSKKKKTKKSTKGSSDSTTTTAASTTAMVPVAAAASAVVKKKKATTTRKAFKIPRPGKDGAADSNLYEGKRFVLTGVFPEIGGGIGLDQGKSKVKSLVESFGGRVTSAVSGVTDYLIVGRNP
jgi:BRCT domain type II-containing protein